MDENVMALGGKRHRGPGLTYSAEGVRLQKQARKRRKNYPNSWGCSADKMKMKKRVLTFFDGQRRLVKDDMMLGTEFEVRMPLPGTDGAYITDLDVESLKRAEGFLQATEEEKGPWVRDNVPNCDLKELMA